ncbi:D-ribose transporter ATP binding protein [Anopheles sinensis]|uniref:D-ribose transporter ATP binding protein n=1 Tax=Anopheles sinensis TaxID=74873 RepID=A0A084VYR3_ANOSI|nr:D-ribose transporter ATP binding protein [Anopheles sinensis]
MILQQTLIRLRKLVQFLLKTVLAGHHPPVQDHQTVNALRMDYSLLHKQLSFIPT